MQPLARMVRSTRKRKLGACKNRRANLSSRKPVTQFGHTSFKSEYVGDAERNISLSSSFNHLLAFSSVHSQWLLAKHRLARRNDGENICNVALIRSCNENSIHLGRAGELRPRIKRQWDVPFLRRLLRLGHSPPRERDGFAVFGHGESG